MITEAQIVKKYLGIPYIHMGRDPKRGLDCWGLVKCVYADCGINLLDLENYDAQWAAAGKNHFIENCHKQWECIVSPQPLDVVLFAMSEGVVNHAGIVLKDSRFIQTCRAGTVICRLTDIRWYQRIAGFYRYKHDQD